MHCTLTHYSSVCVTLMHCQIYHVFNIINLMFIPFHFWLILAMDAYVVMKAEDDTVRSMWVKDNHNPSFDCNAVFYRKKIDQPIIVEVCVT